MGSFVKVDSFGERERGLGAQSRLYKVTQKSGDSSRVKNQLYLLSVLAEWKLQLRGDVCAWTIQPANTEVRLLCLQSYLLNSLSLFIIFLLIFYI